MTEQNQNKKALWIFPNFKESIDELPKSQRALVWQAVCEIGLGYDFDIKKCTTSQKMCIKLIYPLLKLRNVGGSIVSGEKRNPDGKNGLNTCNKTIPEDNPYPNPLDNPTDNPEDNSLYKKEIEKEKEIKNNKENIKKKKVFTDEFERWWSEVPRKVSKDEAFRKFNTILVGKIATFDELFIGIKKYATYCREENKEDKFIKHPSTWLNQGCWKDEYKTSKPTFDDLF